MGYRAVDIAIVTYAPSHAAKLVLICLAKHYNHLTGKCCPSYERIAAMMSLSKSSVTRAIKELVDAKLIEKRKGRRVGTHEGPNHYRLLFFIQARLEERQTQDATRLRYRDIHVPRVSPETGTPPSSPILSEEGGRPKRKRSQRKAIKTRMAADWTPTKRQQEYAAAKGFSPLETEMIAERFKYWWIGDGGVKADWGAVWYNWVSHEKTKKEQADGKSGSSGARTGRPSRLDGLARVHAAAERLAEERSRREGCNPADEGPPVGARRVQGSE